MRVEVLEELEAGDAKLELPWASPADARLRYFDLKEFPKTIERMKECRAYPALARLLQRLNAPGSVFRTAKCDVWTTTRLSEDERLEFKLPCKVGTYVDLILDRVRLNSRLDPQLQLAQELAQRLARCRVEAQMDIAVRRCWFHPRERWGYYLTLFVHAYGATRREAKQEWSRAIESLGEALSRMETSLLRDAARIPRQKKKAKG
jgi:hypothetical protein